MIKPVKVVRDEYGYWTHPDYPMPASGGEFFAPGELEKWLKDNQLEHSVLSLEDDPEAQGIILSYFETGDFDISAWEPEKPDGEGWFLGSIHDTEDGPHCIWFRQLGEKEGEVVNEQ